MESQKIKAITAKCHRNRKRIGLFNRKEENHKSDTGDYIDLDQVKNKYLQQL